MAKKLSTEEILKRARAEGAPGESQGEESSEPEESPQPEQTAPEESQPSGEEQPAAEQPAAESGQEEPAAAEEPAAEKKPAAPTGKPKSTKDILAAARAQDAGGKAKPSGEKKPPEKEKKPAEKKPAASGGGKPKSTKDILAAARAEGGGGKRGAAQKPAAKESPKAAKPSKKAEPAQPKGEHPPVKEMVEALKKGRPLEEEKEGEEPSKPARKPIPKKPPVSPKKPAAEEETSRRFFLTAVLIALFATPFRAAWTLFTGAFGVFTLALARFMMPNVIVEPPSKFKIGPPSDYPFGTVATKWKDRFGIWLVHTNYQGQNQIYALISVCTHLGCTPNWLQGEQKFKCPCHGSGFYITGINFEGPAPRPLERAGIRLAPDGMLEVDKSVQFQEEMGQWQDPDSFVEVA